MVRFSVVIPLFNGANFISATLDSVVAQNHKNFEIVLVNDGSPDNVGEVVKKYIFDHPDTKFVYVEQENRGLGGARNTAIHNSSGEIIAILDQDDIWYNDKLETMARTYKEFPDVDVVCHNCNVRKNGNLRGVYRTGPADKEMYRKMLFKGNRLFTLATTFKKSLIDKVGYFSEDVKNLHFAEDYDLWLRMAREGAIFYFIPDVLAEYVQHDGNFSTTSVKRMLDSTMYVVDRHYNNLNNKRFFDWYRLRSRKAEILYMAACRMFASKKNLGGVAYLLQAALFDPLFVIILSRRIINKFLRIFSFQGVNS